MAYNTVHKMVYNTSYMIEFLQHNWGDLASALGLAATALTAAWAALNARSAKQAAIEARDGIGRTLTGVEIQKAVDLIERIKERHAQNRWEAAADRYPDLRELLYNIEARLPDGYGQMRNELTDAVTQALDLEISVIRHPPSESAVEMLEALNEIQALLQRIASRLNWE